MTIQEKTELARQKREDLQQLMVGRDYLMWREAELLYDLKETRLYKYDYGMEEREDVEKSWKWYCRELNIPPSTADFKAILWKKWIVELKYNISELVGIHSRKLHRAVPYALNRDIAENILHEARHLSFEDFILYLKELPKNTP